MAKTPQDHADWVMELLEDDEEECTLINVLHVQLSFERSKPGGSRPGRAANKHHDTHGRTTRLIAQYFAEKPIYNTTVVRRRFRMSKNLFLKVHDAVVTYDDYFIAEPDATGKIGIPSPLKVTAALRVLAYASSADSVDKNLEMSRPSILASLKHFCEAIIAIFGAEYLRSPTEDDVQRLLDVNSKRGFVGMLGSVDCMHIEWKIALHLVQRQSEEAYSCA